MTASISALPISRPVRKAVSVDRAQSRALKRRLSRQALAFKVVTGVTLALLTVSLTDSARGVELLTSFPAWKGWVLALGIEASYIAAELAKLFAATPSTRKAVAKFAIPYGAITMAMSSGLNALAFSEASAGWAKIAPAAVGTLMPVGILVLSHIGSKLYIDGSRA